MSKTYVIGDLHGRFDLMISAMEAIWRHADGVPGTIITLGDYIDRGPHSKQIIDHLSAGLKDEQWTLVCLKGNHEAMMYDTIMDPLDPAWWIGNGGGNTLVSYGHQPIMGRHLTPGLIDLTVVPPLHLEWIKQLPLMHIDKHRIYVHAGVDETISLKLQSEETLLWSRYPAYYWDGYGDYHVVHGHTPFKDGPKLYRGRTNLDTGAYFTDRLVVGVFDDNLPGGPVDTIEIKEKWCP